MGYPVELIESSSFADCKNITGVEIPDSVETISSAAFAGCKSLKSVIVPASVTSIGSEAFGGCESLEVITILNPECDIEPRSSTISNYLDLDVTGCFPYSTGRYEGIIRGYKGSTAEEYAKSNGYKFVAVEDAPLYIPGDANCDGEVNLADAVLIMQSIANPAKYPLSDDARANADVANTGDGVTSLDALAIQRLLIGKIGELPEN